MKQYLKASVNLYNLLKLFEGFSESPYLDTGKVPTIGYGSTYYLDGRKVTMNDKSISKDDALKLLESVVSDREKAINTLVKPQLNQNQFDALVDFSYNLGVTNFKLSTLLKKINLNPSDPTIRTELLRWNKDNGKVIPGLTKRRLEEIKLYFKV